MLPASDGLTYASVGGGFGVGESVGTAFCAPVSAGEPVSFLVDLMTNTLNGSGVPASTVGGLSVWGGLASCGMDGRAATEPGVTLS
jgi:hypothetical protein